MQLLAGSSVAFGLLHGDRWIAGTIAALLYAAAQKWRGKDRGRHRGAWSHECTAGRLGAVGWSLVFVVGTRIRDEGEHRFRDEAEQF